MDSIMLSYLGIVVTCMQSRQGSIRYYVVDRQVLVAEGCMRANYVALTPITTVFSTANIIFPLWG